MTPGRTEGRVLVGIVVVGLVWSSVAPVSRLTWLMEVLWVAVGLPVVLWGWRRFPLTRLLCWLLVLHAFVLLYGGPNADQIFAPLRRDLCLSPDRRLSDGPMGVAEFLRRLAGREDAAADLLGEGRPDPLQGTAHVRMRVQDSNPITEFLADQADRLHQV